MYKVIFQHCSSPQDVVEHVIGDVEDLVSVLHAQQAVQVAPVAALEDLLRVVFAPGQRLQALLVLNVVQRSATETQRV